MTCSQPSCSISAAAPLQAHHRPLVATVRLSGGVRSTDAMMTKSASESKRSLRKRLKQSSHCPSLRQWSRNCESISSVFFNALMESYVMNLVLCFTWNLHVENKRQKTKWSLSEQSLTYSRK